MLGMHKLASEEEKLKEKKDEDLKKEKADKDE